jgi:hypothetical protein
MAKAKGGFVDYRALIAEELDIPMESIGVLHGDNMLIFTSSFALNFSWEQQSKIRELVGTRVGSSALVRFL